MENYADCLMEIAENAYPEADYSFKIEPTASVAKAQRTDLDIATVLKHMSEKTETFGPRIAARELHHKSNLCTLRVVGSTRRCAVLSHDGQES